MNVKVVAETNEATVVGHWEPLPRNSEAYQTEKELEEEFVRTLTEQGYEFLPIRDEKGLIENLRKQLEALNGITFSDDEWELFFRESIANDNLDAVAKTGTIQEDSIKILQRDDGTTKNIRLIERRDIHKNKLQVIRQFEFPTEDGKRGNRSDVTVLVNGFPLVHIELKRRGVALREAFNQIGRYERESFRAGKRLFEYVQIYVISNGSDTKYYSNSTRNCVVAGGTADDARKNKTSFEFTSYWADAENRNICDLTDFARTFFVKHTLLNVLTKYCVWTEGKVLMAMRPYQIVATERILNRIATAHHYKKYGSLEAGGYIWHTTGSGKTLTSFKTSQLASNLSFIDKVLFVVDRKDLDYQTIREFDKFEKGAANGSTSTKVLENHLVDKSKKILVTTIQKLSAFIRKNSTHPVFEQQVVLIFDECHRSQFGKMHRAIVKKFKHYYMFGFTGTPIFAANANASNPRFRTTEQLFGKQLHAYTIVNAINDRNVLPFRVDYLKTMDIAPNMRDEKVRDINRQGAYMHPDRIREVTRYILEHFNQKTYRGDRNYRYEHDVLTNVAEVVADRRRDKTEEVHGKKEAVGFNSIFAVFSVDAAKAYYKEFQKQMKEDPSKHLKIAVIYSCGTNEEEPDGIIADENLEDLSGLNASDKAFLEDAMRDYNRMFGANYDTSPESFQSYYQNVSLRMKNRELDMLIVVNMFLTGFDAPTLNTLWIDKDLKMHGLLQAFSRTNRILNRVKTFGNVVCFRDLGQRVTEALAVFGDEKAGGIVLIRPFADYYDGCEAEGKSHPGYVEMIDNLKKMFPLSGFPLVGEQREKDFIERFGSVLHRRNLLVAFDEFESKDVLESRELEDYTGKYLDLRDALTSNREKGERTDITDSIVFEIELIEQAAVGVDTILMLVEKYRDVPRKDKRNFFEDIESKIRSDVQLRSKKELILNFVKGIKPGDDVAGTWRDYVAEQYETQLAGIIKEENLKDLETRRFMQNAFREGDVPTVGTGIDDAMPNVSRKNGEREKRRCNILKKLTDFFERFFGIFRP